MDTCSLSRSNQRSNVKISSKIITSLSHRRSATSQRNRHVVPQSVTVIMSAEDRECLFSPCNDQGAFQTFKTVAVQKIVATNKAKLDELYKTEMFAHKSCYCKYTSKSRNNEQKKGKDALAHTVVSKRLLKSQCSRMSFSSDQVTGTVSLI